jgi:hypothetical protein
MSQVFSAAGMSALRAPLVVVALAIAAGAGTIAAGHWYAAKEKRERADSGRRLQEARARVDGARLERDNMVQ